jgi:hypothetical protein
MPTPKTAQAQSRAEGVADPRDLRSALPRRAGRGRDRLGDVQHRKHEEASPDQSTHLLGVQRCASCHRLRDPVRNLLAPALETRLSQFSCRGHVGALSGCSECRSRGLRDLRVLLAVAATDTDRADNLAVAKGIPSAKNITRPLLDSWMP